MVLLCEEKAEWYCRLNIMKRQSYISGNAAGADISRIIAAVFSSDNIIKRFESEQNESRKNETERSGRLDMHADKKRLNILCKHTVINEPLYEAKTVK